MIQIGNITIRMNDDLKARVNQTLDAMGMNFNTYVTMASIQLVNQQRLPFDTSVRAAEPNEQTKRAMLEAEAKERGILPDDAATFNSAQDAIAWLHNNHG